MLAARSGVPSMRSRMTMRSGDASKRRTWRGLPGRWRKPSWVPSSTKPSGAWLIGQHGGVGPPPAAEGTEEVRLVGALEAQGVVAVRGARALALFARVVLENARIDDQAPAANREFE